MGWGSGGWGEWGSEVRASTRGGWRAIPLGCLAGCCYSCSCHYSRHLLGWSSSFIAVVTCNMDCMIWCAGAGRGFNVGVTVRGVKGGDGTVREFC